MKKKSAVSIIIDLVQIQTMTTSFLKCPRNIGLLRANIWYKLCLRAIKRRGFQKIGRGFQTFLKSTLDIVIFEDIEQNERRMKLARRSQKDFMQNVERQQKELKRNKLWFSQMRRFLKLYFCRQFSSFCHQRKVGSSFFLFCVFHLNFKQSFSTVNLKRPVFLREKG